MKKLSSGLSVVLLGVFLLSVFAASQASSWKLEEKINPDRKELWVSVSGKETTGVLRKELQRSNRRLSLYGQGFGFLKRTGHGWETLLSSTNPLIVAFSPDQKTFLKNIHPAYHYLFVIPMKQVENILAEHKCVIASRKVKTNTVRQFLDDKGEWTIVSETEGESYVTLIAAPNKRTLKKAITRFFTLSEVPLEPIIFVAK